MIKNTDNLNKYKNEKFLNFYKKYEKEITPYIGKYEKTRIIYAILFTILAILSTVLFERIILLDFSLGTIISMGLFDFCVICLIYDKINDKFKNKIKQTFIPKIIQTIGEIHWNTGNTIISDTILEKSKLFGDYNIRSNDDTFEGKYNGIEFKVSETNLSYESGSGDKRTVSTVFKNLQTAFGTKNIKCAFFDNKIMFALHTNKDFFELSGGLFHSLKHPKRVKSFYEETTAIYDIIDYFKLDEKTGL